MSVLTQHNFTGTAGTALGSYTASDGTTYTLWDYQTSSQTAQINAAETRARSTNTSGEVTYASSDPPTSANQYAEIVVYAVTSNTGAIGILLRAGSNLAYWFTLDAGSGRWVIYNQNGGSFPELGDDTITTTGGNSYTLRAEARGPNLRFLLGGSLLIAVSNSDITAAGEIAIYMAGGGGSIGLELTSIETGEIDPLTATLDMILPQLSMAMEGTVSSGADVTGTMAMTLPQLSMALAGLVLGPTEYIDTGVDNRFIESVTGLTRSILTPTKYGSNPIYPVAGTNPHTWDYDGLYGTVLQLSATDWRYWYACADDAGVLIGTAYATSTDGITWNRPSLGLVSYESSTANNLILGGETLLAHVRHYPLNSSGERFVGMAERYEGVNGVYIMVSADGINWTLAKSVYVDTGSWETYREGHELDRLEDGRYVAYYSTGHDTNERALGRLVSDSSTISGSWTDEGLLPGLDSPISTAQFYDIAVHKVDRYTRLGMVGRYNSTSGKIHCDLYTSHDEGYTWTLLDGDWLALGGSGTFDDEMLTTRHDFARVGNTWRLYYQGYPIGHAGPSPYDSRLGLAEFGYGRVSDSVGTGSTKARAALAPLRYLLTADGTGGTITAELLNPATGTALSGFATTDFDDVTTDVTEQSLTWNGATPPAGTPVQLVIHLADAEHYSYQATDTIAGTMALVLPQLSMSMSGIASTTITATLGMTLPQLSMSMEGDVVTPGAVTGTMGLVLPQLTMSMSGTASSTITGTMALVLPQLQMAMSGSIEGTVTGTLDMVLPQLRMSMSGTVGATVTTVTLVPLPGINTRHQLPLVRNDDYIGERAISFPAGGNDLYPTLDGAITFTMRINGVATVITGSVETINDVPTPQVEIPRTALTVAGTGIFDVQHTALDNTVSTLVMGDVRVLADVTVPEEE